MILFVLGVFVVVVGALFLIFLVLRGCYTTVTLTLCGGSEGWRVRSCFEGGIVVIWVCRAREARYRIGGPIGRVWDGTGCLFCVEVWQGEWRMSLLIGVSLSFGVECGSSRSHLPAPYGLPGTSGPFFLVGHGESSGE